MRKFDITKTITTEGKDGAEDTVETYMEITETCLRNGPSMSGMRGISIEEMEKRLSALAALQVAEKNGDQFALLTDEQADTIKGCVKNMRWVGLSEDLVNFGTYVKDLPAHEVKKAKKDK